MKILDQLSGHDGSSTKKGGPSANHQMILYIFVRYERSQKLSYIPKFYDK